MKASAAAWPLLAAALLALTGAGSDGIRLGGVAVGRSVLDVVHLLGIPGLVRTTDRGHEWQWADSGGLDREILTDDNLIVHSVLVAVRAPRSGETHRPIAQPSEAPILGLDPDAAASVLIGQSARSIPARYENSRAWLFDGGVLVAEMDGGAVARLIALDEAAAHDLGYVPPPTKLPPFRAPQLREDFVPPPPFGNGTVIIRAAIDAKGAVTEAHVVVSSGSREIDDAETLRVTKSTYDPALCDGQPCAGIYMDIGWYWSGQ